MIRRSMACREVVELVTDYLEGVMSRRRRRRLERHLEACGGCRAYVDQMRETIRLTGMLTEESLPSDLRGELLRTFRQRTTSA